ncbi:MULTISPECIES: alpha/beta hydrolase [Chitinophagaceae]
MSRFCFLVACLLLIGADNISAQQQDSTYILGNRYVLQSSILKETCKYWVRLPQHYNATEKYPVIYVLDGEMYFPIVSTGQGFLDGNNRLSPNKSIVVAIENTDRTRDLTPTPAISVKGNATMENSGKGEQFLQFLQNELIPQIEKQYSVSNRRILIGHSFGGLAATYFFLKHPASFTDYIIIEPALWWDDSKLLAQAQEALSRNVYPSSTHVFLAFAKQKDTTDTKALDNILQNHPTKNITLKSQYYPDETHGTIYVHALYDGLRFVFDMDMKKLRAKPPVRKDLSPSRL